MLFIAVVSCLETDGGAALLDGLDGILNLVDAPRRTPRGDVVVVLVAELPMFDKDSMNDVTNYWWQ